MRVLLILWLWASAAAASDPDADVARRHFTSGRALFQARRFREALVEFEQARQKKPLAAFDYNLAMCHEELGELDEAIGAYERYLASTLAPDAEEVRRHIAELRERRGPVRPPAQKGPSVAALAATGAVAGAALLTGIALLGSAADDYNSQTCSPRCNPSFGSDLEQRADAGYAFLAIGGALAVVEAVLVTMRHRHPAQHAALTGFRF
jgi:tetratricopeptide (TPR) repeat protein